MKNTDPIRMLGKLSKLAMNLMVVATIPGCDSSGGSPPVTKEKIVGKWLCTQGAIMTTYEIRPDGTCTKSVKATPDLPETDPIDGTWTLSEDWKLTMKLGETQEIRQITVANGKLSFAGDAHQVFYLTH
jgi:hypothetical protein